MNAVMSPKDRDHSKDQGVDGRMGPEWILGRLDESEDWIRLVQNRDRWRAVINAVMIPKERDHSQDQSVDGRMGPE
jgi:hypothetical protein